MMKGAVMDKLFANDRIGGEIAGVTRRHFLLGSAGAAAVMAVPGLSARAAGPRTYALGAAPASVQLLAKPGSPKTAIWAYGGKAPGPLLRARQGERLRIELANGLPQETTVHCHGLRLPNAMDGVPGLTQAPVAQGGKFVYEFDLPDAGMFWYHPHIYATEQVERGLSGVIIVDEPEPPKVDRELVWLVDDWRVGDDGQVAGEFNHPHDVSHGGRLGNLVTINGAELDHVAVKGGERIRLRMVNAANARVFGLHFAGLAPRVIALDGHPVTPYAPAGERVAFGPGQRIDLILDIPARPGELFVVRDDYYQRFAYDFVTFAVDPGTSLRESPLDAPVTLKPNPLPEPDLATATTQDFVIEGGAMGGLTEATFKGEKVGLRKLFRQHGKAWTLNGIASSGMGEAPMFNLARGKSYRWRIKNDTVWDHPMHLHGHAFRILSRNGKPVPAQPWADTVLLHADETAEVAFVADNPGKWLFHCHVLEHHHGGMGAVVEVA